jgi:starvation-inducible DNA-binding protein
MFPSRIKLPPQADREAIVASLNKLAISLHDLSRCCKHAHLNMKGDNYHELHLLYDDFAADALDQEDVIAEIIVGLGGMSLVFCGQVVENTVLSMMPADCYESKELLGCILEAHGELDDYITELIDSLFAVNLQTVANEVMGTQAVIQKHIYKLQGFAA